MSEKVSQHNFMAIFQAFESSLSPEQRLLLLQHPQLLNPAIAPAFFQSSLHRMENPQTEFVHENLRSSANSDEKVDDRKPRKVVNSWMAFRTYYSPLMKDLPQKNRSPMLSALWKKDTGHGLWELLSAAFSYIRDNHSEDRVSLDQFLQVATQVVPVVGTAQYFECLGWRREGDSVVPIANHPRLLPQTTNLSCAEVVQFCFSAGLLSRPPGTDGADFMSVKGRKAPPATIAFAAMASVPLAALATNPVQAVGAATQNSATGDIEFSDDISIDGNISVSPVISTNNSSVGSPSPNRSHDAVLDTVLIASSPADATENFAILDMQECFRLGDASLDPLWGFDN